MTKTTILTITIATILITSSFSLMQVNALPSTETLFGGASRGSSTDPGTLVIVDQTDGSQT